MNREEFIKELKSNLTRLPAEELDAAVGYYEEYLYEAGPENESSAIKELGSPSQIAKQIMADFMIKEAESTPVTAKNGIKTIWIVILALLASPIALPLAIAGLAVLFAIVVTVGSLVFAGGVVLITLVTSGIAILGAAFKVLFIAPLTSVFFLGGAMVLVGLGLLGGVFVYWVVKKIIPLIVIGLSKLFKHTKKGAIS